MIYTAYQAQSDLTAPMRAMSGATARLLTDLSPGLTDRWMVRSTLATTEIVARWGLTHRRPAFGIDSRRRRGRGRRRPRGGRPAHAVRRRCCGSRRTRTRCNRACCSSRRCRATSRRCCARPSARCCRTTTSSSPTGTTRATSRSATAAFGLDEYIDHLVDFLREMGPGAHIVAVCQPCVPALAAAALMAEDGDEARAAQPDADGRPDRRAREPDDRQRPRGRALARVVRAQRDRDRAAAVRRGRPPRVPRVRPGRRVHADEPGAPSRGVPAPVRRHRRRERGARGRDEGVLRRVLRGARPDGRVLPRDHRRDLPGPPPRARASSTWRGRPVDPAAITRTALLTVEGERDDICGVGQTAAAHDLCTSLTPDRRRQHLQAGAGHFGVFSGARWEREVYPEIRSHILKAR